MNRKSNILKNRKFRIIALITLVFFWGGMVYSSLGLRKEIKAADVFLKFDEGYGTTSAVHDTNNAVSAGTITGAVWKTEDLCFDGKCFFFDGDQDYVLFSDDDDLDFAAADSFTITLWFRHAPITSGTHVLIAKLLGSDHDGGYSIQMESDGDITCAIAEDDANAVIDDTISSTAATYDDNKWHHVTCVKSGTSSLTLYIDSLQVAQDTALDASSTLANNDAFY